MTTSLGKDIQEKTLEAWVQLNDLGQKGSGVIGIQSTDGQVFDSIVFGEKSPQTWMAGSDTLKRSQGNDGPKETEAQSKPIHVAITYSKDGTITRYRKGQVYGDSYKTKSQSFEKGKSQILFGMRHGTKAEMRGILSGRILRAQFYDRALNPAEIAASAGTESNFISDDEMLAMMSDNEKKIRDDIKGQIKSITGNKITVNRGQDGSTATTHLGGADIHKIDTADDALIETGDDFGFSGGI